MVTIPISISGVGIREAGMRMLMIMYFNVPENLGASLGFAWTSINLVTGLIGGLVFMLAPKLTHENKDENDDDDASEAAANIEKQPAQGPKTKHFQSIA